MEAGERRDVGRGRERGRERRGRGMKGEKVGRNRKKGEKRK